jgi:hypothetical protein
MASPHFQIALDHASSQPHNAIRAKTPFLRFFPGVFTLQANSPAA